MSTCNSVGLLGAAFLSVFLQLSAAEAKRIRYDINGQTYSYDTIDRLQAAIAQHRIAAAKAADEARARARAERSASLWVRLFGSPIQDEADRAEAELKRLLSTTMLPLRPDVSTAKPIARSSPRKLKYLASLGHGSGVISPTPGPPRRAAQLLPTATRIERPVSEPAHRLGYSHLFAIDPEGADAADSETRAKLVERFKASALAEERRRLDAANRAKGFARPADLIGGARVEPNSTGSTDEPTIPQVANETLGSPHVKGLCGLIFFGLVSGCK
jgi:hypothetical protein